MDVSGRQRPGIRDVESAAAVLAYRHSAASPHRHAERQPHEHRPWQPGRWHRGPKAAARGTSFPPGCCDGAAASYRVVVGSHVPTSGASTSGAPTNHLQCHHRHLFMRQPPSSIHLRSAALRPARSARRAAAPSRVQPLRLLLQCLRYHVRLLAQTARSLAAMCAATRSVSRRRSAIVREDASMSLHDAPSCPEGALSPTVSIHLSGA